MCSQRHDGVSNIRPIYSLMDGTSGNWSMHCLCTTGASFVGQPDQAGGACAYGMVFIRPLI